MAKTAETKKEKLDPKDAARAAARYYKHITESSAKLSIEELEYDEKKNEWLVTLSYVEGESSLFGDEKKIYKIFRIDAESGNVISMKIRAV